MKSNKWISILFWVGGIYDALLGVLFLLFGMSIFEMYNITPPNHIGYIQFPAALLIIFGLMFIAIARNPIAWRHFIIYGILLKVAYCGTVFSHWFLTGLPWIWKPFAICDLIFGVLFVIAYMQLKKSK
jgi:hypothetical protein